MDVIHDIFIRVHEMAPGSGMSDKLKWRIPLEFGLPDTYKGLDLGGSTHDIVHLCFGSVHVTFRSFE